MKNKFLKLLTDGLLIIFSVLFALFINRYAENAKTEKKKEIAIERIEKELLRNQAIITGWTEQHAKIKARIVNIVNDKQDSLRLEMLKYPMLRFDMLIEKSLVDDFITNTAWQAARSTDIISEFDYDLILKLTNAYSLQEIIMDKTLMKLLDLYFDTEAHNMDNFDPTLLQLQLRFQELVGQEHLMQQLYREAIDELRDGETIN